MTFIKSQCHFAPSTPGCQPFVAVVLDGPWATSAYFGMANPEAAREFQREVHALAADIDAMVAMLPPPQEPRFTELDPADLEIEAARLDHVATFGPRLED